MTSHVFVSNFDNILREHLFILEKARNATTTQLPSPSPSPHSSSSARKESLQATKEQRAHPQQQPWQTI
jgi:hypothetical protein